MLARPWDAAPDPAEWQDWLAPTDRFGMSAASSSAATGSTPRPRPSRGGAWPRSVTGRPAQAIQQAGADGVTVGEGEKRTVTCPA
jgi:hypothetical protein